MMFLWTRVLDWFPNIKQRVFNSLYRYLAQFDYQDWTFMNYGYADARELYGYGNTDPGYLVLSAEDEADRYSIQLYAKVVSGVFLKNKVVLEVGCGRGGGVNYLHRYHSPAASHGVDLCRKAIDFCRRRHNPGLYFKDGDAADLPYRNGVVDVVINVESSHCYPSRLAFFREAYRVLKAGGKFCLADLHNGEDGDDINQLLRDAGFVIDVREDITRGVIMALEFDSDRKSKLINLKAPWWIRRPFGSFAGLVGTRPYRSFVTGARQYTRWQLTKPL